MGPAVAVVAAPVAVVVVAEKNRKKREAKERHEREVQRQKNQMRENLRNQINALDGTIKMLNEQLGRLENIKKFQVKFTHELTNNTKICVAIGKTGVGKSTLLNKLFGDKSLRGNKGPFKVFRGVNSGTQELSKHTSDNISFIDTPGIFDSNNKDKENILKIMNYLKGSPGINSFIIAFNGTDSRYDTSKMQMLQQFDQLFGKTFWKHVILVITKIDDLTKKTYEENIKEFRNIWPTKIRQQFNLNQNNAPLKVFSIGIGNVNSITNIKNIIKSNNRLISNTITFENPNTIQNKINDTNNRIANTKNERSNAQNKLNSV